MESSENNAPMNSTTPTRSRAEKSAKTRARKKNPLRAAKLVAQREVPAVKVFRSGREVCSDTPEGRFEYRRRVEFMVERQENLCCICGEYMHLIDATFEHGDLRGMGGGRRNDSEFAPGNGAAHGFCNGEKRSVRRTMRTTI